MNKRRLGLLTGTHAVNDLYQGLVPALLPFMVLERGYSYTAAAGLMLAATGLSSVVQPLFGLYADRHPRSWLVPTGFLVAALGVVLAGLSQSYLLTWIAIALCGLGIAAYHPPATVAARAAGGASQKAMSVFSVGGTIGASFAPVLAATAVGGGSLSRSYLLGVPAVVMGVVWLLASTGRAGSAAAAASAAARKAGAAVAKPPNDWRAFGWLVATIVGWSIPYVTVLSMLSLRITRDLHGTAFQGAAALTAFTAAGAVGTLLGGWLGDRIGRMGTIRAGYLLALPALAGLVLAPSAGWALACTALLGMSMFLPFAAQVTLAQDYLPRNPATASGITLGLALSVGGLVSPLFGMLSDARGLGVTLTAVLCVLCVATVLALRLRNRSMQPMGADVEGAAA
ncbi:MULTISPECIES: MFS transporter [unclassified Variovorax]|jgi:FSR family fosmidomycin resistance protein-like MFS transporter|uniref:MFS transporter n=1 Tax=unclassified Variovorax TaxID=663243 RepID=UPI0008AD503C|nr:MULTISPECIES: MFS transporter [unclassified Variovorax]SEK14743.1 MFS transporter, FSR family, fosmidomycin resistance protein [Variovorax sp. OK202]SFE03334.1 MFS transporter, FSR family, fosmidomycin resistance protein [Variovorax sp. OK212]